MPCRLLIALLLVSSPTFALAAEPAWQPVPDFFQLPQGTTLGACSAAAVNSRGEIFIFHRGEKPVLVFDGEGKFLRSFGADVVGSSHGLRVDRDDNLWATDIGHHRVYKFDPYGKVLLQLGTGKPGDALDQFNKPTDVAFGPGGAFYVTDGYGNTRVLKFSPSGAVAHHWGAAGNEPGQFNTPHAIVRNAAGKLYVGDRENRRIQIFDEDGRLLDVWSGFHPYGLAFDAKENLYVADGIANEVLRLDAKGQIVDRFGKKGNAPGEFDLPHMLTFDVAGDLFVTEITGKRVQKFTRK